MRKSIFGFLLLNLSCCLFAQRVISPVSGVFANRQSLVLDLSDGAEAYYSYSDSNPLVSGFAYDGPVLIDTAGAVSLRVIVLADAKQEEYEIHYTVDEIQNPFAPESAEGVFIDSVTAENVLLCSGENAIDIPESFLFCVGDDGEPVIKGTSLFVRPENRLSRYVPCTVTDGTSLWRFMVYVSGGDAGVFAKFAVPFEIQDWNVLTFTGRNLIWCIDDGIWSASDIPTTIDRSTAHTVYWQNVAYEKGNPIQSFVLPAVPVLRAEKENNSVVFRIDGDMRYRMELVSGGSSGEVRESQGVLTEAVFDTFSGDCISGNAVFAVYCGGVYQGNLSARYEIDKKPPAPPRFISSENGFYVRNDVELSIEAEKGARIFFSVAGPYPAASDSYIDVSSRFDFIENGNFDVYDASSIRLKAGTDTAVYYRIMSYARDEAGNTSSVSEYAVIIDEYNYFIDADAPSFAADGSRSHPYNSFEQVLSVINSGRFAHFFVSGTVVLPEGETVISSNSSFTGLSGAKLLFCSSSFITVNGASLEIQNCVLEKQKYNEKDSAGRFFVLENSAVNFEDCEFLSIFDDSGTAFTGMKSVLRFTNSGLTVQGTGYSCGISAIDSKIVLKKSRFAAVSDTAVNFSLSGGSFEISDSECMVISRLGRIIEASGVNLKLSDNVFRGDFSKKTRGVKPVWYDEKSLVLDDTNNVTEGF